MQKLLKVLLIAIGAGAGYIANMLLISSSPIMSGLNREERGNLMLLMVLCGRDAED
jgi:hypothetical protein